MQSVVISKNQAGQRFDKFLHRYLPEAGSGFLYKMLRKKNITLNGKKAEGNELLNAGDTVSFFFSEETFAKFRGCLPSQKEQSTVKNQYLSTYQTLNLQYKIHVLYEDDDVCLIDKPAGLLTQKAGPDDRSLNEWLIGYLLHSGQITAEELTKFHPSVCNRLDRNTSGIVLCGKSLPGLRALSCVIKQHQLTKIYHTVCYGTITKDSTLEGYLVKNTKTNQVTCYMTKPADCDASAIKTFYHPLAQACGCTYLEVELFTGKTHQIRAHLAAEGHPLIGDHKYGCPGGKCRDTIPADIAGLPYQLLHAQRVSFPPDCPLQGLRGKTITAPLPESFVKVLSTLGLFNTPVS